MEDDTNGGSQGDRSPGAHREQNHFSYLTSLLSYKTCGSKTVFSFFLLLLFSGVFIFWTDTFVVTGAGTIFTTRSSNKVSNKLRIPLNCSFPENTTTTTHISCPRNYLTKFQPSDGSPAASCPDYFRWIHHDLDSWRKTGITRETLELGKPNAHFRLVIANGKMYVETYGKAFQTRDVFTIWGIVQLLRLYPGQVPDLELMFYCNDRTVVLKRDYQGPHATWPPPPVFHYCGNQESLDIVFPDWTFWGWPEVNIRPWNNLLGAIKKGNKNIKWKKREPYAYWKGNPNVSRLRKDLMRCNFSDKYDPNVRLYAQDWLKEIKQGFKNSKLEDQCTHRYKIYVEGAAWSVSEKYILACNSMTLLIKPYFYDFFTRDMFPMRHYWPISPDNNKCRNLKFAVDWGNKNTRKAQSIGKAGSEFIQRNLSMNYVYDYMLHSLREYSKLLKFKVQVPEGAKEVCSETMACHENGVVRQFMEESMVMSPSQKLPCALPPPYDEGELSGLEKTKESVEKQVQTWETEYWDKLSKNL